MRITKALVALTILTGAWLARPALAQQTSAMRQVGMVRTGEGTFTIDVEGADIRTVCRAIAEFSGRNIVVAQSAKGTVRVSLRNVGWREALRTICRLTGLDFVEENGIIRVDETTKLNQEAIDREQA